MRRRGGAGDGAIVAVAAEIRLRAGAGPAQMRAEDAAIRLHTERPHALRGYLGGESSHVRIGCVAGASRRGGIARKYGVALGSGYWCAVRGALGSTTVFRGSPPAKIRHARRNHAPMLVWVICSLDSEVQLALWRGPESKNPAKPLPHGGRFQPYKTSIAYSAGFLFSLSNFFSCPLSIT